MAALFFALLLLSPFQIVPYKDYFLNSRIHPPLLPEFEIFQEISKTRLDNSFRIGNITVKF